MVEEQADDEALLQRWREGEEHAGVWLARRYIPRLTRFFHNKLHNVEDVSDLVSETMLGCVKAKEAIPGADFRRYIFGIALNQLRRYYRTKNKRGREQDDFSQLCAGEHDHLRSLNSLLSLKNEVQLLARALRRLPMDQQIVLELGFFEGLSAPQIAEVLNMPAATIYTRQRRGKHRLLGIMKKLANNSALYESAVGGLTTWVGEIRAQLDLDPALQVKPR